MYFSTFFRNYSFDLFFGLIEETAARKDVPKVFITENFLGTSSRPGTSRPQTKHMPVGQGTDCTRL